MNMLEFGKTLARNWIKQRRLDRQLGAMADVLAHGPSKAWHADQMHALLQRLLAQPAVALRKGAPDLLGMKKCWGDELRARASGGAVDDHALQIAEKMAAVDPRDELARLIWLHAFVLRHSHVIDALMPLCGTHVALHMSCVPRLDRAQASVDSFADSGMGHLRHLCLVGHAMPYELDATSALLKVPAQDTYEHLPSKVVDAYALLACVPGLQAVIKMDDDHRLANAGALQGLLNQATREKGAVQFGHVYHTPFPAAHSHGWHLGKCKDPMFAEAPFGFPAPLSWATGEFGYVLNRPALLRMLWARLYYRRWLSLVMYEDIALGEIADKLGIRKIPIPMDSALRFHGAY
jgi:Galactosyltransferase